MRTNLKISGDQTLLVMLRSLAQKVPENARKTMHRGADRIVKEAQLNTPVDLHNLEESIRKVVRYENRGRLNIEIQVGGMVNGVNVDEYAMKVHENYDDENPGQGTRAKRSANPGRYIGRKFLERALAEEASRGRLQKELVQSVMLTIATEDRR